MNVNTFSVAKIIRMSKFEVNRTFPLLVIVKITKIINFFVRYFGQTFSIFTPI